MLSLTSPARTPHHRIPAALKLIALCVATIVLFQVHSLPALGVAVAGVAALYAVGGGTFLRTGLKRLRPLWIFVVVITLWHGIIGDLASGFVILLRLAAVVGLANLVTMTTELSALIATATRALSPLRRIGVNPAIIGFCVGLVLRFIPVMIGKTERLVEAWKSRSPRRPNWRLLMPIFLTTLDDAEQVAEALRARGGFRNLT